MEIKKAIKRTLKYQLIALVPTILGFSILFLGFYVLFIDALLDIQAAMAENGVEWIMNNENQVSDILNHQVSPFIGTILMVVGYAVHRLGRTVVFMKIQTKNSKEEAKADPELLSEVDENET